MAEKVTGTGAEGGRDVVAEGGRDVVATPARAANSSMVRVWSSLSEFAIVPAYVAYVGSPAEAARQMFMRDAD